MRFFCSILFTFLLFGQLQAQIIFKPFSTEQLQLSVDTLQLDSSNPSNPSNLSNLSNPVLKSGIIQNTFFEFHIGGNNEPLQAVLLQFDTAQNLTDSQCIVVPVGIAKKRIYWGQIAQLFRLKYIDAPFLVCILSKDSNQYDWFAKNYLSHQDFDWVEVPHKKDSSSNVFEKISIDEFLMPLPCSHDPVYLEYLDDSTLNLSIDNSMYFNMNVDSSLTIIEEHLRHLDEFHGAYCERKARIFFSHRNVDMKRAISIFERFSEMNVQLELIFSTND